MNKPTVIKIDDVEYVRSDCVAAASLEGLPFCIVRTYSAGVFAGYIAAREGQTTVMRNVRRLWYWDGAASLSQLAVEGVKKPQNCKFTIPVEQIEVLQTIEILSVTRVAQEIIEKVPVWKQ